MCMRLCWRPAIGRADIDGAAAIAGQKEPFNLPRCRGDNRLAL
jgi:hypothetical protein